MFNVSDAAGNESLGCISPGELRLYKDILEINLPDCCKISFPNGKDDIIDFRLWISPTTCFYRGGVFGFYFDVTTMFPQSPPKVSSFTKVCHPYIDLEGNVLLHILTHAWKPYMTITNVVDGLYRLFTTSFNSEDDDIFDQRFIQSGEFGRLMVTVTHAIEYLSIYASLFFALFDMQNDTRASNNVDNYFLPIPPDTSKAEFTKVMICDMVSIVPCTRIRFHENETEE
ncbi:hypothetical protein LXL04_039705 [Taraxacum kok-saghyz]